MCLSVQNCSYLGLHAGCLHQRAEWSYGSCPRADVEHRGSLPSHFRYMVNVFQPLHTATEPARHQPFHPTASGRVSSFTDTDTCSCTDLARGCTGGEWTSSGQARTIGDTCALQCHLVAAVRNYSITDQTCPDKSVIALHNMI